MSTITPEPTAPWQHGIALIPSPQQCTFRDDGFVIGPDTVVALSTGTDADDDFAAVLLAKGIEEHLGLSLTIEKPSSPTADAIRLIRGRAPKKLGDEGYTLEVASQGVTVRANGAAGIFYAVQTLLQLLRDGHATPELPGMRITDWPDYRYRSVHYDTKHHQDTFDYVARFIARLASYKVNVLIWEWEDKLAYKRRPEIGAPGAFTIKQMQQLTALARRHHVQLVPLVQGLGHVSFILKHRKYDSLREVPASNWEFCPLKDGTYDVLFDLWADAMEATPGVDFLHIGTDECYELGQGDACGCSKLAEEKGKKHLQQIFIHKADAFIRKHGRTAISWSMSYRPGDADQPPKGHVTFSGSGYNYAGEHASVEAVKKQYPKWLFCPNPGIEPLFLMLFPFQRGETWRDGSLADTANGLNTWADVGVLEGMVVCSWDDSGLHNEMWNMRHICGAAYAWNAHAPSLAEFTSTFFTSYFGPDATDLDELYRSMQDRALWFYRTLQRQIWHHGHVGKMTLPDLPRDDLEFDPFWRQRYADDIRQAQAELLALDRCAHLIHTNLARPLRNRDNLEILLTCVDLARHNATFFLRMAEVELNIGRASHTHWIDRKAALRHLHNAEGIVAAHIAERKRVFNALCKVWNRDRLAKGMSTAKKPYLWAKDRARHWANRRPDMTYLIYDEQRLDMEGWLRAFRRIVRAYEKTV